MMQPEDLEAGKTATAYTDLFVDAAIAKLDAKFGKGYAKENPVALASYLAASAQNLHSFMLSAAELPPDEIDFDALQAVLAQLPEPPRGKRGR